MSKTFRKINPRTLCINYGNTLGTVEENREENKVFTEDYQEKYNRFSKKVKKVDKKHFIVKASDGASRGEFWDDEFGDPVYTQHQKKFAKARMTRKTRCALKHKLFIESKEIDDEV